MSTDLPTYTVYFAAGASTSVKVQASDPDAAIEAASFEVYISLCHHCARKVDLGDPEATEVMDADGNDVTPAGLGDSPDKTQLDAFAAQLVALDGPAVEDGLRDLIGKARKILGQD